MTEEYSDRLVRLQTARWKRWLGVQRPYKANLRSLRPGYVLDVGCGIGRNLEHLGGHGVGVDLDPASVDYVRRVLGYTAYSTSEFPASAHARHGAFDSLLLAHVLEHVDEESAVRLVSTYLPYLASDGRVIVFTPQERGFDDDPTHVRFFDEAAASRLASSLGLRVARSYSFPFHRSLGRIFRYNEFVFVLERS